MRTPFALTGSATDSDGDALIYLWEQNDRGAAAWTALAEQHQGQRSAVPGVRQLRQRDPAGTLQIPSPGQNLADGNPTRVFPDMAQILAEQHQRRDRGLPGRRRRSPDSVPMPDSSATRSSCPRPTTSVTRSPATTSRR